MMTQEQPHRRASDKNNSINGKLGALIRKEFVAIALQSLVLVGGFIAGYASLRSEVVHLREILAEHISQSKEFVRDDVWRTRNAFIDEKLNKIEGKIDIILAHRMDEVRKELAKK